MAQEAGAHFYASFLRQLQKFRRNIPCVLMLKNDQPKTVIRKVTCGEAPLANAVGAGDGGEGMSKYAD
ncbi:MAG: hypothetical protein ABJB86_11670 [Bacteroidota bacterium]